MMNKLRWLYTYVSILRILPAYIFLKSNHFSEKCKKDLDVWISYFECVKNHRRFFQFGYILLNEKETRNIFLNRLHRNPVMFVITRVLYRPLESLYINMPPEKIGGGFSLQHGFSTIIAAKEIGEYCRVFQQVTIGYNGEDAPVIGDNVTVGAGAIVIGNVHLGDHSFVGAGAVVTRDVLEGATVVGVPAREINRK